MMSAFFSAVSGLKSETSNLNVIANNISNVNTTGYKSSRVSFSDLLSQTLSAASGSTTTTGGTNPVQVGLGVSVASTDTNMTTGSTQSTGIDTDVAISGDGFFVVENGTDGSYLYTREGDMTVDEQGNLTVDGYKVCGYTQVDANGNIITTGGLDSINVYDGDKKTMPAAASTKATFTGTLNSSKTANGTDIANIGTVPTTADNTSTMTFYDAQGNAYSATVSWYKCYVDSTSSTNPLTSWYYEIDSTSGTISPASGYIEFDKNGKIVSSATSALTPTITSTTNATGYTVGDLTKISGLTPGDTYTVTVTGSASPYTVTLTDTTTSTTVGSFSSTDGTGSISSGGNNITFGSATLAAGSFNFTVASTTFATKPTITVAPSSSVGTAPFTVDLDLSAITTGNSTTGVAATQDGYASGTLSDLSIESDGTIVGTYSNGKTRDLAAISLAVFTNDEGLEKSGENLYKATSNSGTVSYYIPGEGSTSSLSTGCLEMSNVDLAQEFSNMMIAQRAYQANSKIITTADEMLQSLISMK